MDKAKLTAFGLLLGGAVALGTFHFQSGSAPASGVAQPEGTQPPPKTDRSRERSVVLKVAQLEERLSSLEASRKEEDNRPQSSDQNSPAENDDPRPEPTSEELLFRWDSDFENERYDASWAPHAERTLTPELGAMAEASDFRLDGVQCKSNGCVATLEFKDYAAATNNAQTLAVHAYAINCGTRVTMPKPSDDSKPYRTRLFLRNCLRAGDANPPS